MTLRSYVFIALTIQSLEQNLEQHQREQEILFSSLNHSQLVRSRLEPLVTDHRRAHRHHPYSHTPSPVTTPSDSESHHPPSSDEPRPPHRPITRKLRFQNVRFVGRPSLPTRDSSYHTAPEESTEINPNNFLMQQPSNERGPPIGQLQKMAPLGT